MGLNSLRQSAGGGIGKFILGGFLVMAVGGLVVMDVGGVFRGGVAFGDIANVGGESINLNEFDRNVRTTLNRIGLEPTQAYQFGYIDQILGNDIRARVLAQTASKEGIAVDNSHVAEQIKQLVEPIAMRDGENTKDVFHRLLLNQGISEAKFVHDMKRELGSALLTTGIEAGFSRPSQALVDALYRSQKEQRDVEFITFLNDKVTSVAQPSDEQLKTLYDATKEQYAVPERRVIRIASLNKDKLKEQLVISEGELRAEYDNNVDLYKLNKTQTLDLALLDTQEQADSVVKSMKNGKSMEDAIFDVTNKKTGYLGEQKLGDEELIENIKDEVLANQEDDKVIDPIQSPLGWYVVHVKAISPAHTQSFEEVKESIREDMIETQLFDQEYEIATTMEDMIAGGASLDEVKESIDLDISILPAVDRSGRAADVNAKPLADYEEERASILEQAFSLDIGETSSMIETQNGKFMVVQVQDITQKSYPEFESVKSQLQEKWMADQRRIENRLLVQETLKSLQNSGKSLKNFAAENGRILSRRDKLGRGDKLEAPLTIQTVNNMFEAPVGEPISVSVEGGAAIAVVQAYHWPEQIDRDSEDYLNLEQKLAREMENEAMIMYLNKKQTEVGISVNSDLIARIYGPDSQLYTQ